MSIIQLHVLRGTVERVKEREQNILILMTGQGYTARTLMRVTEPDKLEYISGESPKIVDEDWQPNIKPGDTCVVLSFKK